MHLLHAQDTGILPPQAKFRGKSLAEWSVLATQWQIATGLGGATDLSDTVKGVQFLPGAFDAGQSSFDIVMDPGTPFVSSSFFVFGELYDDMSMDDPGDPVIDFISQTTYIETCLDGQTVIQGYASELDSRSFGPSYFDEPIFYSEPQPRGADLNSVAALFVFGIGGVYRPLPVGMHTLVNHIDSEFFGSTTITYNILVAP